MDVKSLAGTMPMPSLCVLTLVCCHFQMELNKEQRCVRYTLTHTPQTPTSLYIHCSNMFVMRVTNTCPFPRYIFVRSERLTLTHTHRIELNWIGRMHILNREILHSDSYIFLLSSHYYYWSKIYRWQDKNPSEFRAIIFHFRVFCIVLHLNVYNSSSTDTYAQREMECVVWANRFSLFLAFCKSHFDHVSRYTIHQHHYFSIFPNQYLFIIRAFNETLTRPSPDTDPYKHWCIGCRKYFFCLVTSSSHHFSLTWLRITYSKKVWKNVLFAALASSGISNLTLDVTNKTRWKEDDEHDEIELEKWFFVLLARKEEKCQNERERNRNWIERKRRKKNGIDERNSFQSSFASAFCSTTTWRWSFMRSMETH